MTSESTRKADQYLVSMAAARGSAGQHGVADVPAFERLHEGPCRQGPKRNQDGILIPLQPDEIVERDQRQQEWGHGPLLAFKPQPGQQKRKVETDPEIEPGQQIISPVGGREDREPAGQYPARKRRVLRITPSEIAGPHRHLAEIGVDALSSIWRRWRRAPRSRRKQRPPAAPSGCGALDRTGLRRGARIRQAAGRQWISTSSTDLEWKVGCGGRSYLTNVQPGPLRRASSSASAA